MGEAKHRRARVAEMKVVKAADLAGYVCAWDGCAETFSAPQPPGWRWLLVYGARESTLDMKRIPAETWDRDAALCPKHAAELDGNLKRLVRMGKAEGSA
jgi:hypothetical protein